MGAGYGGMPYVNPNTEGPQLQKVYDSGQGIISLQFDRPVEVDTTDWNSNGVVSGVAVDSSVPQNVEIIPGILSASNVSANDPTVIMVEVGFGSMTTDPPLVDFNPTGNAVTSMANSVPATPATAVPAQPPT